MTRPRTAAAHPGDLEGPPDPGSPAADTAWARRPERSNHAALRLMTWISLRLGRRAGRLVLWFIAGYFLLFAPAARRASRAYLARVLERAPRPAELFRHFLSFAATIHDRIYLLNERFDLFDIRVHGVELIRDIVAGGDGVFLIGAHMGSFEVIRAVGRQQPGIRVAMVMYEDNAQKINRTLAAINPAAQQDIIPLGRLDSMLQVRERLDDGTLVGMLADRSVGPDAAERVDFLGEPASFPAGPWRIAAMLKRPVILMVGLYRGGNRYDIHFEPLADFTAVTRETRGAAQRDAIVRYAARLEHYARLAPFNWFNFFDFWQPARGRDAD
ncbi:acyl-CoA synthetase [Aromatoleum bremense]|uniref:LpxL/LpxP family acyltransferase n=1 Tax=Aromatoleum bremense TaxID=76115 RepID=UPI001BB6A0D9|nr:acyl-CoA synthetase [Aromatoleum bremense]QTQ33383.1 Bacterial lipid A biosynthesis acyltransferase family protein [Aromatoleum bremense]